jgi:hypothetical protein
VPAAPSLASVLAAPSFWGRVSGTHARAIVISLTAGSVDALWLTLALPRVCCRTLLRIDLLPSDGVTAGSVSGALHMDDAPASSGLSAIQRVDGLATGKLKSAALLRLAGRRGVTVGIGAGVELPTAATPAAGAGPAETLSGAVPRRCAEKTNSRRYGLAAIRAAASGEICGSISRPISRKRQPTAAHRWTNVLEMAATGIARFASVPPAT